MSNDLAEFLLARIGEDQRVAGLVLDGQNRKLDSGVHAAELTSEVEVDPTRINAESAAKRRLVELHRSPTHRCTDSAGGAVRAGNCPTLRLVALPYADHPDYREEWRP